MNHPFVPVPLHCWTLTLLDTMPGPSIGDAAEHIEKLGFDPWSFEDIDVICETTHDRIVTVEFVVTGVESALDALRRAHAQMTGGALTPILHADREVVKADFRRGSFPKMVKPTTR